MRKILLAGLFPFLLFAENYGQEQILIDGMAVSIERENYSIIFSLDEISLLEERLLSDTHSLSAYIVVLKNRENFSLEEKDSYVKLKNAFKKYLSGQ